MFTKLKAMWQSMRLLTALPPAERMNLIKLNNLWKHDPRALVRTQTALAVAEMRPDLIQGISVNPAVLTAFQPTLAALERVLASQAGPPTDGERTVAVMVDDHDGSPLEVFVDVLGPIGSPERNGTVIVPFARCRLLNQNRNDLPEIVVKRAQVAWRDREKWDWLLGGTAAVIEPGQAQLVPLVVPSTQAVAVRPTLPQHEVQGQKEIFRRGKLPSAEKDNTWSG